MLVNCEPTASASDISTNLYLQFGQCVLNSVSMDSFMIGVGSNPATTGTRTLAFALLSTMIQSAISSAADPKGPGCTASIVPAQPLQESESAVVPSPK